MKFYICALLLAFSIQNRLTAQSSINPDISIIPNFQVSTSDQRGPDKGKIEFNLEEVEMAIQSALNPYARADIFVAFANDPAEPLDIEEAYFTIQKGLPLNFNLKGGKFLVDFSKLNSTHAHAFPFVNRPTYQQSFFGEEGLKDVGVEVNTLIPTGDIYTKWSGTVATGDELDGARQNLFFASRINSFIQASDYTGFEIGIGTATGISDSTSKRFKWYNADLKYKWKKSQYTSLTIWAEGLLSRSALNHTYGFYTAGTYQFMRRFETGAKYDWSQAINSKNATQTISANFNFLPAEETLVFRFLVSNTKPHNEKSYRTYLVQTIFSLGPHKAHVF